MFNNSKYTKWYYNIINKAKLENRKKLSINDKNFIYYESHHIIPKSLGGNDENNLVLLTAREHFIIHLLLIKMLDNPILKMKMSYALINMKPNKKYKSRYQSKHYELFKTSASANISGKNSPLFNNPKSSKTKEKISKTRKELGVAKGKNNPMFNKQHTSKSIKKMSETKKERNKGKTKKFCLANPLSTKIQYGDIIFNSYREAAETLNVHRRVIKRHIANGSMTIIF